MNQIYPNEGLLQNLKRIAGISAAGNYWQLYENDVTPGPESVLSNFVLSTFTEDIQLDATDFDLSQVQDNVGTILAPNITFGPPGGAGVEVYGYVVMDSTKTILIAVARFDEAPKVIGPAGFYQIVPIFGDYSEFVE